MDQNSKKNIEYLYRGDSQKMLLAKPAELKYLLEVNLIMFTVLLCFRVIWYAGKQLTTFFFASVVLWFFYFFISDFYD